MINVMENKVLGPMLQQQFEDGERKGRSEGKLKGKLEGKQEGQQEGKLILLQEQLTDKFGPLPGWATRRLQSASAEDLRSWAKRVLRATTLEETLL